MRLRLAQLGVLLALLVLWQGVSQSGLVRPSLLPAPTTVAAALVRVLGDRDVVRGIQVTAAEVGVTAFDYFTLTNSLRVALYARATTELLPFAITSAAAGRFAPLLGMVGASSSDTSLSIGAQLSMLCAEDWALARDAGPARRTGGFMRDGYYEIFDEGCELWPHETLPASMQQGSFPGAANTRCRMAMCPTPWRSLP